MVATPGDARGLMSTGVVRLNLLDYAIGALFAGIADAIRALGIRSLDQLVWIDRAGPPLGTFWPHEWSTLLSWYWTLAMVALLPGLINAVLGVYGLKAALASGNSRARLRLYELFSGLVAMLVLILFTPWAVQMLLELNAALTGLVAERLGAARQYFGSVEQLPQAVGSKTLLGLMQLVLVGVELMLNYLYVIRKVVIGASLVLLPLAGWVLVFRASYTPLLLLVSEIVSNTFMQTSHAVTIAVLVALVVRPESQTPWWILMFAPTMLPLVSAYLRRMLTGYLNFLGVNEERWAGLAAVGVGSMLGIARAGGGMLAAAAGSRAGPWFSSGPGGGGGPGTVLWTVGGSPAGAGFAAGAAAGALTSLGSLLRGAGGLVQGTGPRGPGGGSVGIPVTGSGANSAPRVRAGEVLSGLSTSGASATAPDWTQNLRSGGNAVALGAEPPATVRHMPDLPMARTESGLYVPADLPASAPAQTERISLQPASTATSVGSPQGERMTGHRGGATPPAPSSAPSGLGKAALRAAEVAFKGTAVVSAAMIGAGMASAGRPGMVSMAMETGQRLADAAWTVPQKTSVTARQVYDRLKAGRAEETAETAMPEGISRLEVAPGRVSPL